jgi:hypothetical protein
MRRRSALALVLFGCASCWTPVPAEVRLFAPVDRSRPPVVYVTANKQRGAVEASLSRAGFALTETGSEATLFLVASLGSVRREGEECGAIRNVKYVLQQYGTVLASGNVRGPTGDCADNALDQLARELAESVLGLPAQASGSAPPRAVDPGAATRDEASDP